MARKLILGAAVAMVCTLAVSQSVAEENLLRELYGQGVHAYFSNNVSQAHEFLSMAIEQGSKDPRCYYYRGLAYAKLGRPDEAQEDFKKGAEFEAAGGAAQIDVGQALQRVQGSLRLDLEKHRYSAKLAARLKEASEHKERYEDFKRDEPKVIREPAAANTPANAPSDVAPPPATPAACTTASRRP